MRALDLIEILHSSECQRFAEAETGLSGHFRIGYMVSADRVFNFIVSRPNRCLFINVLTAHLRSGQILTSILNLWWVKRSEFSQISICHWTEGHLLIKANHLGFPGNLGLELQVHDLWLDLSNSVRLGRFHSWIDTSLALNLLIFYIFTSLRSLALIYDFIYF